MVSEPKRIRTLEEVRQWYGPDTVIALEPSGQWVFDLETGRIRRLDNRFYDIRMMDAGGYEVPIIYEEPGIAEPSDPAEHRIIAFMRISVNPRGYVKVSDAPVDVDGHRTKQLVMSSLSNPEMVQDASDVASAKADIKSNRNRISGYMRAFRVDEEFPDEEGMLPDELAAQTTDGRTLAALRALGL
jgi:hypothetical protein